MLGGGNEDCSLIGLYESDLMLIFHSQQLGLHLNIHIASLNGAPGGIYLFTYTY